MKRYHLVHFQNPEIHRETALADWHRRSLAPQILELDLPNTRIDSIQFSQLHAVQLQPGNPQPWRFATLVDFSCTDPELFLSNYTETARDIPLETGLVDADATHLFSIVRSHQGGSPYDPNAQLHYAFVMGNCIAGREEDYDTWYDQVHGPEVLGTPGFVSMRRGVIAEQQCLPENDQPSNRLVLLDIRTHDLHAAIDEFIARAHGTSSSGVRWAPRESAASFASLKRTTHVFSPYSPNLKPGAR